ncbi:unnamed protein product [Thelazia callipaeda]|uniref:Ubiquitin carboxyl-terminal hydrolase n=1 Tax=Thelazia callipaeda TaxID=103827 RepID=A0A0N5CZ23_THECL|nr:unnamed protein product [Thelazia callipaeda]
MSAVKQDTEDGSSVYNVKWVGVEGVDYAVVMQNHNGPCPLLAVVNALLLRGQIVLKRDCVKINENVLIQLVADCIVRLRPDDLDESEISNYEKNVSDVLTLIPSLSKGLDVNVFFTGVHKFEYTAACALFDVLNIPLLHGWIADPENQEMVQTMDGLSYNRLVEKLVSDGNEYEKSLLQSFLDSSPSQLTIKGILDLQSRLRDGEIAVLFRNNHFHTLSKNKNVLYVLVTDSGFLTETEIMWETLESTDGNCVLVDASFNMPHHTSSFVSETAE